LAVCAAQLSAEPLGRHQIAAGDQGERVKAAVVLEAGKPPVYGDFQEPVAGDGEIEVAVSAAALSHVTRARASGTHYSSAGDIPFVAGVDGVGHLDNGHRVYFTLPRAPFGSMAQRTVVGSSLCVAVPDGLDDATAAAIAIPGMSSWAALKERAAFRAGETVLINGATGTSGRLAVQIARHLGARKVIATGRNTATLRLLPALGADVTISLAQEPDALERSFQEQFGGDGVSVVLDYLWGPSAEHLLIAAAKAGEEAVPIRFIQVGSASASTITLPSAVLRSSAVELKGSGVNSIPVHRLIGAIDELFKATVEADFEVATRSIALADVQNAWSMDDSTTRTVFTTG
jgi:NADPH:quinone reductase-like Zn-dependent oxidoreductase